MQGCREEVLLRGPGLLLKASNQRKDEVNKVLYLFVVFVACLYTMWKFKVKALKL